MMGSGKTTVGRLVATRLGWTFVDSDEQVCQRTGRTVREIFETDGEAAFRREESAALRSAAHGNPDGPAVVAVAGGAVLDPANRALLHETGAVVWLEAPATVLAGRVRAGADHRPLLGDTADPEQRLAELAAARGPLYRELADAVLDVSAKNPTQLADEVLHWLHEHRAGNA
jgi:shikimate kinase